MARDKVYVPLELPNLLANAHIKDERPHPFGPDPTSGPALTLLLKRDFQGSSLETVINPLGSRRYVIK